MAQGYRAVSRRYKPLFLRILLRNKSSTLSLPKRKAESMEPMECAPVSKLLDGTGWWRIGVYTHNPIAGRFWENDGQTRSNFTCLVSRVIVG